MDNIMDKVNEILSDPESLKQIQELASMLNSETQATQDNSNSSSLGSLPSNSNTSVPDANTDVNNNDMPNIDFAKLFQLLQTFNSASNSQDTALLLAIKPYLTTERQNKVDKAIKLMKVYDIFTTAKNSGILNSLDGLI